MTIDNARSIDRPSWFELARSARDLARRLPLSWILLLARIALATIFLKAGLTKTANFDLTIALFADEYQVPLLPPALAAYLATAAELGCAALLYVGLATRLACLPLLVMTAVIQLFVYPSSWGDHIVWFALLLLLVKEGAGKISLDYPIARWIEGSDRFSG